MGYTSTPNDEDHAELQLRRLEERYRAALQRLTGAKASYLSLQELADADSMELRQSLARVQRLQMRLTEIQAAMELIEDGVHA